MGYNVARFQSKVSKHFICAICFEIAENAHFTLCQHIFCKSCIVEWLMTQQRCPVDNHVCFTSGLSPMPRMLQNIYDQLEISCDYAYNGCTEFVELEKLSKHVAQCKFDPQLGSPCAMCEVLVPKNGVESHDCFKEMRDDFSKLRQDVRTVEHNYIQTFEQKTATYFRKLKYFAKDFQITQKKNTVLKKSLRKQKRLVQVLENRLRDKPNKKWWEELYIVIGKLHTQLVSQGSLLSCYANILQCYKCPLIDWNNYTICTCEEDAVHYCGIQDLQGFQLTIRTTHCRKVCLIHKEENLHVPNELIPKSGFVLFLETRFVV